MTPEQILRIRRATLGFLGVVLKNEPMDNEAQRTKSIARLIETFCSAAAPAILSAINQNAGRPGNSTSIDYAIELHKAELLSEGSAQLPDDRQTLLKFYDRLHQRQQQRRQRHFYATGSDAMIAARVLKLIEEEIDDEDLETQSV